MAKLRYYVVRHIGESDPDVKCWLVIDRKHGKPVRPLNSRNEARRTAKNMNENASMRDHADSLADAGE